MMVAPTCDFTSSPTIGRPFSSKRRCQYGSRAMKTGMQLTNAQPASSTCSTYHLVAISLPTGRKLTTTWVCVSRRMPLMSAVLPGALVIICERYWPRPSCVIPRWTGMPSRGTSANFTVLFGAVKIASERSRSTLLTSMSNAAENSMSPTWYSPTRGCMSPGMNVSSGASR